ncbi:hypothetical protein E8E01_00905 [Methylorubrum populi]|uniref:hypothetical protein n=1 Tax=Methylorubrum populi TaxID=223967 RepID=UPI0011520E22|nr:hypothetical protein [Methylorubrum populi]QDI79093.1 hypothetical protein E8E01_00905 [Methylorubrum populi]
MSLLRLEVGGESLLFRWRRAVLAEQQAQTTFAPPTFFPLALPPPAVAAAERPPGRASSRSNWLAVTAAGQALADLPLLQGVVAALLGW